MEIDLHRDTRDLSEEIEILYILIVDSYIGHKSLTFTASKIHLTFVF